MPDGSFSTYLPDFARYLETSTRLAKQTIDRYLYELRVFAEKIGDPPLAEVSPQVLLDWNAAFHDQKLAPGTINQKHAALRKFCEYLDLFLESPEGPRLVRALKRLGPGRGYIPQRTAYSLSQEDFEGLLATALEKPRIGERDAALLHFLWDTGCRAGEASALLLPDLDLAERVAVVVGKRSKQRAVRFTPAGVQRLASWLKERLTWRILPGVENVFISSGGRQLSRNDISTIVHTISQKAGSEQPVWSHLFRHSAITRLLNNGMPLQDVSKFVGHDSPATTLGYMHQDAEHVREAYDRATNRSKGGDDGGDTAAYTL